MRFARKYGLNNRLLQAIRFVIRRTTNCATYSWLFLKVGVIHSLHAQNPLWTSGFYSRNENGHNPQVPTYNPNGMV